MRTLEEYRTGDRGFAAGGVVQRPRQAELESPTQELAASTLGGISDEVLFGQIWSCPGLELAHGA